MRFFAGMFIAAALATFEMKQAVAKAAGGSGAGFRKNKRTVATGRALLLAYAAQHRAKQDISRLMRM